MRGVKRAPRGDRLTDAANAEEGKPPDSRRTKKNRRVTVFLKFASLVPTHRVGLKWAVEGMTCAA
jgi:hypothetical protein